MLAKPANGFLPGRGLGWCPDVGVPLGFVAGVELDDCGVDGAVAVLNFDAGEGPGSVDGGTLAHPAASKAITDSAAT